MNQEAFTHICSFCWRNTDDLVVGPEVSICFECVQLAAQEVVRIRRERKQRR